jgi:hypothetical protein
MLEVRLSFETKARLMAQCRADGTTASDVVRTLIEAHLTEAALSTPHKEPWMSHVFKLAVPVLAAALAGTLLLGAGGVAEANPELKKAEFARLDVDKNGRLTIEEFAAAPASASKTADGAGTTAPAPKPADLFARLDADKDGVLTEAEYLKRP